MNRIADARDNPNCPSRIRSPIIAPTNLPLGPPLAYPIEQINLPMIATTPMTAVGMGKQMPATKCMTRPEGANSMKLQWARCALLNLYHCSQESLAEQRPLPMSGQPPFSMSFPVAVLWASPKWVFMKSSVKTSPLTLPGKRKPMRSISKAMSTPTKRTYPQSLERVNVLPKAAEWMTSMCIYIYKGVMIGKDLL